MSRALVAFLDRLRELCGEGKLIQMAPKVGGGVGAQTASLCRVWLRQRSRGIDGAASHRYCSRESTRHSIGVASVGTRSKLARAQLRTAAHRCAPLCTLSLPPSFGE